MVCASCIVGVRVAETPLKASRLLKIQAARAIIGQTDVNERTKCTEIIAFWILSIWLALEAKSGICGLCRLYFGGKGG